MPDIRYVCMSDLHFGAENSLLSHLPPGELAVDPTTPSPSLTGLVDGLASVIDANEDKQTKPTLVLNGDILELALASDEVAVMAFEQFIKLAFVDRRLFDGNVIYQPGNHDHHIFETARERAYADYVSRHPAPEKLAPPWHATPMFAAVDDRTRRDRRVHAQLVESVIQRFPGLDGVGVEIRYPLLGLETPDQTRAVGFHHGHYIESIYRLMSTLKTTIFPASPPAVHMWEIESENFAWVDFFWSTLGRSGTWGKDVGVLYAMLEDERAVRTLADNLADASARHLPKWIPGLIRRRATRFAGKKVAARVSRLERRQPGTGPLTPENQAALKWFLEGPVRGHMVSEERAPQHFTFVFGHTHKPFEAAVTYDGFPTPVDVYNSGGWVVDDLKPASRQGASAVLLDEELRAVNLHLYDQVATRPPGTVTAADSPDENPFLRRISGLVDPSTAPWTTLAAATSAEGPRRHQALRAIIDRGVAEAKKR